MLRAAEVGMLSDARLELMIRALCRRLGYDEGRWVGERISLLTVPAWRLQVLPDAVEPLRDAAVAAGCGATAQIGWARSS